MNDNTINVSGCPGANIADTINNTTNLQNRSEIANAVSALQGIIAGVQIIGGIKQHLDKKHSHKKVIKESLALVNESIAHASKGNRSAEINCLIKAIKINPECDAAYNLLAWTLALSGEELDKALECAKQATLLKHTCSSYYDTLAEVYYVRGDMSKAMALSQEALNLCSSKELHVKFLVYHRAGRISISEENFTQAITYFRECLNINAPNSGYDIAGVYYGLSVAHWKSGEKELSIQCMKNASTLRPELTIDGMLNEFIASDK